MLIVSWSAASMATIRWSIRATRKRGGGLVRFNALLLRYTISAMVSTIVVDVVSDIFDRWIKDVLEDLSCAQ